MLFSELHTVKRSASDDWFDPILDHDTKVFIDPFLIFRKAGPRFTESHGQLMAFFRTAFELAARTGGRPDSAHHKKLLSMLLFPEVDSLRLGFAKEGHGGAGTAKGFARDFAGAIMASIAIGLTNFQHFEEIGIFNTGIGCDRVSDITANVLLPTLIAYTQEVCSRHAIPTEEFRMRGGFNLDTLTWEDDLFALPRNPFTDDPVLLVPKRFLRTHPTLEKDSFKDYLWDRKNEELRNDLSFAIKADLDAEAIITIAREHREWVQEFVSYAEAEAAANAYDLDVDPDGLYKWHRITREFVANHPYSATVASDAAFGDFVASLAEKFKLFVELKGGWKLIWDQDKPLSEEGIQNYFYGVAYHYCAANSILMQREVETGRGPVDFYFSSGYHRRALMEAKLAKNGHFWNNLRRQLPEYMTAEGIARGHYLIVCYSDDDITKKADRIRETLQSAQVVTGYQIAASLIDARPSKPSASKLR